MAKLFLEETSTLKELRAKIGPIFSPKNIPDAHQAKCNILRELTIKAPHFDDYASYKSYLMQHSGIDEQNLHTSLRFLLSGAEQGPDMAELYTHIKNYLKEVVK